MTTSENNITQESRYKPLWKIVRFFLLLIGVMAVEWSIFLILTTKGIISSPEKWNPDLLLLLTIIMEGPAIILVTVFTLRKEHISFRMIGLAFHRQWLRELWWGFAIGMGLITAFFLIGTFSGVVNTVWNGLNFGIILIHGGELLLLFGLQCFIEELIFRGYPFQLCLGKTNPIFTIMSFSILFGVLHAFNPDVSWLGVTNAVFAGVLLSLSFLRIHALWMPIGIHWGWNFAQGFLFSFPVSGMTFPPDMFSTIYKGQEWISGGSFGPEGSIISMIILTAASLAILYTQKIQVDESMQYGVAFPEPEKQEDKK